MPFPTEDATIKHLRARGFLRSPDRVKHIGAWRVMRRDTMRFMYVDVIPLEDGNGFTYRGIAFYNTNENPPDFRRQA